MSDGARPGEAALLAFPSQVSEARGVAALVQHLVRDEGLAPSDIVVLFRGDHNAAFSGPIKAELIEVGIPVEDPTWVNAVLDDAPSRTALLLLRLLANRHDSLAWAGLLKLEPRVGAAFMTAIYDRAAERQGSFAEALLDAYAENFPGAPAASARRAKELVGRCVEWLDRQDVPEELEDSGWGTWIVETLRRDPGAPMTDELADLLSGVDDAIEPGVGLGRYLGQIQPLARDRAQAQAGGVRFMSMASSKGLTVEGAIVVAAEEGVIPRPDADVAEERRLMYVAMTRARRFQYVPGARRRTGPTARAGAPRVRARRTESRFLRNGPVQIQDGETYIAERWRRAA
jgi:superfamily I DNA/RNA helicase